MRRTVLGLFLYFLAALPARAHFIWLLPEPGAKAGARVVFSDQAAPDDNADLLEKIKQTKAFTCDSKGAISPVKCVLDKDAFAVALADGPQVVFATCKYGLFSRGQGGPSMLYYYAKTFVGTPPKNVGKQMAAVSEQLDLDIVFVEPGSMRVLWKGKPLQVDKVYLHASGAKVVERTADKNGVFTIRPEEIKDGNYAVRVGHTRKESGEHAGKKYEQTRHWATFVFKTDHFLRQPSAAKSTDSPARAAVEKPDQKEDAGATKLLADARAARANWESFPGFSADLEVNVEGKVTRGRCEIDPKGKVTLSGIDDKTLEIWARRQLSSIAGHRMGGGNDLKTPCAFGAEDQEHPLGRAIQVLNDEFHSSYRIRDRQVIVVNRKMKDVRFTITVLENKVNAEKQYLPSHYVVSSWDLKTEALRSSQSFHHDWARVGKFDLPGTTMIVAATNDGKLEARKLVLTNHKLK